jgi:hypothetical protein
LLFHKLNSLSSPEELIEAKGNLLLTVRPVFFVVFFGLFPLFFFWSGFYCDSNLGHVSAYFGLFFFGWSFLNLFGGAGGGSTGAKTLPYVGWSGAGGGFAIGAAGGGETGLVWV